MSNTVIMAQPGCNLRQKAAEANRRRAKLWILSGEYETDAPIVIGRGIVELIRTDANDAISIRYTGNNNNKKIACFLIHTPREPIYITNLWLHGFDIAVKTIWHTP